jgi:small redox-active disulfide protein 2
MEMHQEQLPFATNTIQEGRTMEVTILGTGCPNCKRLEKVTREALAEMDVEATVTKVTDMVDILAYNIPATPGLVIDGTVVSYGRIPKKGEIASLIATALSEAED